MNLKFYPRQLKSIGLTFILFLVGLVGLQAQTYSGVIQDADGEPLIGDIDINGGLAFS
jgi:hypothetical protein